MRRLALAALAIALTLGSLPELPTRSYTAREYVIDGRSVWVPVRQLGDAASEVSIRHALGLPWWQIIASAGAQIVRGGGGASGTDTFVMGIANHLPFDPLDSQDYRLTYYNVYNATSSGAPGREFGLPVPVAATLKSAYWNWYIAGTAATTENVTHIIRKNDTTDTSGVTGSYAAANGAAETGLSVSYSAGDRWHAKISTPAWATNPTNVQINVSTYWSAP